MNVPRFSLFVLKFSILSVITLIDVLEMEAVEDMVVEYEDLIDITEEAELIQAERFIDDSDPREVQDRGRNKDDIRMLEKRMLVMNLDQDEIQVEGSNDEWEVNSYAFKKILIINYYCNLHSLLAQHSLLI